MIWLRWSGRVISETRQSVDSIVHEFCQTMSLTIDTKFLVWPTDYCITGNSRSTKFQFVLAGPLVETYQSHTSPSQNAEDSQIAGVSAQSREQYGNYNLTRISYTSAKPVYYRAAQAESSSSLHYRSGPTITGIRYDHRVRSRSESY